jgi:glycosyltransferase A (GT-A) superfamily protein (DUF2064 family)
MPAARVRAAFTALQTQAVVIGPARDGGYYLLGQWSALHPADLFTGIAMSTDQVCALTRTRAKTVGLRLGARPASFDVDESADLEMLRAALRGAPSGEADPVPATLAALAPLLHEGHSTAPALSQRRFAGAK